MTAWKCVDCGDSGEMYANDRCNDCWHDWADDIGYYGEDGETPNA
jgi:hypothetical protein